MDIKIIVQQAAQGDQQAFTVLYKKYKSIILSRVTMFTNGDRELAEDITQETFVKVFNNIHKFDPNTNFQTWTMRIAKNTFLDHLKLKNTKTPKLSLNQDGDEDEVNLISTVKNNNALQVDHQLECQEIGECIDAAVNRLFSNNMSRLKIFELRFKQELKYEEISAELNMPMGTVKTEVRLIKLKLQEELANLR